MATISAKTIGIYKNTGTIGTPVWKLVTCSTTDGFSGSTDSVDASSKCDGQWSFPRPGKNSWEFSGSGLASDSPGATEISHEELLADWAAQTESQFKFSDGVAFDVVGSGFISSLSFGAEQDGYLEFDFTITGQGPLA